MAALVRSRSLDLTHLSALFILFLVLISGHFTFQGLKQAYPNDVMLALAMTTAVQGTIFICLIFFPKLNALGQLVCLLTYFVAMGFSVIFAFIYIYSTGYGDADRASVQREIGAALQTKVATLDAQESQVLIPYRERVADRYSRMRAEEESGLYSDGTPGRGPTFARLKKEWEDEKARLAFAEEQYQDFQSVLDQLNAELAKPDMDVSAVTALLSRAQARCQSCDGSDGGMVAAFEGLVTGFSRQASYIPSSFEASFQMLTTEIEKKRVWITLLQASLFDFLSLFVGIFRAMIMQRDSRRRGSLLLRLLFFIRRAQITRMRLDRIKRRYLETPPEVLAGAVRVDALQGRNGAPRLNRPSDDDVVEEDRESASTNRPFVSPVYAEVVAAAAAAAVGGGPESDRDGWNAHPRTAPRHESPHRGSPYRGSNGESGPHRDRVPKETVRFVDAEPIPETAEPPKPATASAKAPPSSDPSFTAWPETAATPPSDHDDDGDAALETRSSGPSTPPPYYTALTATFDTRLEGKTSYQEQATSDLEHEQDRQLNSFIAEILSTCLSVAWREQDLLDPLKTIIKKLEALEHDVPSRVGLLKSDVRFNTKLAPVVGILLAYSIMVPDQRGRYYLLNRDRETRIFVDAFYRLAASDPALALKVLRRSQDAVAAAADTGQRD